MSSTPIKRTPVTWAVTIIAILFGLLTIKSGGSVLFIDGEARVQAGNYVPFVLWFNFMAGFAYLVAGVGLWRKERWAVWLATLIAMTTLAVFALFALHILNGGNYEQRTVIAMSARSLIWSLIAIFAWKSVLKKSTA
ncbi:MAG: hypothetical protein L3J26_05045 [Candidatus Polarisedimenticolaceae bacterium]|nr:hypothetical protein [Candidatus Polarisedimenticolaceae bacterium]